MSECPWNYEDPLGLPDDLRQWLDARTLVGLVFDAVHTVLDQVADEPSPLPVGNPRVLLTVLTYSYAIGLFASDETEAHVPTDGYFSAI